MDTYIVKGGKKLKYGYTTGTCATAASVASAIMLFTKKEVECVSVALPSGEDVQLFIHDSNITDKYASCCVIKESGDDPDVTDGAKIYSKVKFKDTGILLKGGKGVGTITAKGLQCDVGQPAINPVPQKMINENINRILKEYNYTGGLEIEISVENGEELAKKTFNPRLGIKGGISILGTTGIVEPMSERAIIDTIKILIDKQYIKDNESILISPGNYGEDYCKNNLHIDISKSVKVSNYIGEALDYIKYKGFKNVLFVGHIGKLVKIAGGIMNTHSSYADCRFEIISAHTALCGGDKELIKSIMDCKTTDEAFDLLKNTDIYEQVKNSILDKIMFHINYRLKDNINFGVVMFNTYATHVIKSKNADSLINLFTEEF